MNSARNLPLVASFFYVMMIFPAVYFFVEDNYTEAWFIFILVFAVGVLNELVCFVAKCWSPLKKYLHIVTTRLFLMSLLVAMWWNAYISSLFLSVLIIRDLLTLVLIIIMHCQSPVPLYVGNSNLSTRFYFMLIFLLELIILSELAFQAVSNYLAPIEYTSLMTWFSYCIMLMAVISGIDLVLLKLRITSVKWPLG